MPNVKQKYIKPGANFNYAEGVKVYAEENIYKNQIVYVSGSTGRNLKVRRADADATTLATEPNGRLMIAKTNITSGTYGIVLPWRLITDFNTNSASGVGAAVYLHDSVGTSEADNLSFDAPTGDSQVIVVGRVTVKATAANGGAMMICPSAPESRNYGGTIQGDHTADVSILGGRPLEQLVLVTTANTGNQDFTLPYGIIVTGAAVVAKADSAAATINMYKGETTDPIAIAVSTGATINIKTFSTGINLSNNTIPAGTVIRIVKGSAGTAGDLVILDYIRA